MKKIYTWDYDLEYTTHVANIPSYPFVSQLVDIIRSQSVPSFLHYPSLILGNRSERMESMLRAIVGHLNIEVNEVELNKYFADWIDESYIHAHALRHYCLS